MVFLCVSRPNKSKFRLRQRFLRQNSSYLELPPYILYGMSQVRQVLAIFRKNIYVS
jgi:hypothetical protein